MQAYQHKTSTIELSNWLSLPRSVYYYKPKTGKSGIKPSSFTLMEDGTVVSNEQVVEKIRKVLSHEFVCYGYEKTCKAIQYQGFKINKKKVYRLMNENNLLLGKVIKTTGKRKFVQQRKIKATMNLEYLSIDIKYIWIPSEWRNYYLMTVLNVNSRMALGWVFQKSIRKMDVINLFRKINLTHPIKGVNIRNDNGSQFIANDVRAFLWLAQANQEFTHIATPQENAYIEAFHSIFEKEIMRRFEFEDTTDARLTIEAYFQFYNNERLHREIGMITPAQKWAQSETFSPLRPTNAPVGEALTRPADSIENKTDLSAVPYSLGNPEPTAYICLSGENINDDLLLNNFRKTVQFIGG